MPRLRPICDMALLKARELIVVWFLMVVVNSASADTEVDEFLDRCVSSKNHKKKPGPEGQLLKSYHCQPWTEHSCCTWNTSAQINDDGVLSLYGIVWDQCPQMKNMSDRCRRHFEKDICFYECSPYLSPWIVTHAGSVSRSERIIGVPLCMADCIEWYHDCLFDYTCNDKWGVGWKWSKKGTTEMCPKECKTFKEYFPNAMVFCEKIFNYSFKYSTDANNCMTFSPTDDNKNKKVAEIAARAILDKGLSSSSLSNCASLNLFAVGLASLLAMLFNSLSVSVLK